jgi:hypothetical protein
MVGRIIADWLILTDQYVCYELGHVICECIPSYRIGIHSMKKGRGDTMGWLQLIASLMCRFMLYIGRPDSIVQMGDAQATSH